MQADQCVAHRGYRHLYPENTLLGHQQAVAAGALFVETDIQMSADGIPVLYHDMEMIRLSGCQQSLEEVDAKELKTFSVHEPERFGERFREEKVATLEAFAQWLATVPAVTAYIEIKPECRQRFGLNAVSQILNQLRQVFPQIVIISFDVDAVGLARHLGAPRVGVVLDSWEMLQAAVLRQIQPDVIFCDQYLVPDDAPLTEYATPFVIYEVSDLPTAQYWIKRGAYQIETYNIGAMLGQSD
jgi:glycerophosphoryl diester phosphodiesterase